MCIAKSSLVRAFILIAFVGLLTSIDLAAQVSYVKAGTEQTPDPEAFLSVVSPLSCSTGGTTVPEAAFVKLVTTGGVTGTDLYVNALQTAGGHCDVYISGQYYWSTWRHIDWIYWSHTPPGGSTNYFQFAGPWAYSGDPQTYDTRNPAPGGSGADWELLTQKGTHKFTFRGAMAVTGCNYPAQSNLINRSVNIMQCEPKWAKVHNPAVTQRLPATTISLYVPSTMWERMVDGPWNDGQGPAQKAADAWNTAHDGIGPFVEIVDSDCGSGGDCIKMEETTETLDGCAAFQPTSVHSTGLIQAYSRMKFPSSTWFNATDDRLQRSIAHELGHGFGMNHNTCAGADSIMGTTTSCTSPTGLSIDPTAQDGAQTRTSPYGNGQEAVCGF